MKTIYILIFLTTNVLCICAQTGPGGVGNSTNNALWLKANAGTSTTTNGSPITTWSDMSGNSNHVSQATAVQQPLYTSSLMNNMPAILFDNNSTAGQNDYLSGADASNLDNTNGLTIFTVTRMNALGNAQSIIAKRTNVGVNQAYMFFYWTSNFIYTDIESNDDRWTTTPTAFATNTNYILDLFYDGTIADPRSRVYSAQTLVKSGNESATSLIDYASPLIIGSTHVGDNRAFAGYMSEVILYREALNAARRIIVDNYLSSKYAIALSANDIYGGDTPGNGNFDFDVAGIGQTAAASTHTQFSPSATLGMGLTYVSGFDNGDFVATGQNLTTNANINTDIAVVSGGPIDRRWERIWYIDVTNTSTAILADVVFDGSDGGFPTLAPAVPTNYKLLYRATNSGSWTIVATASAVSGDQITFGSFSFAGNAQDGYYTIGTLNNSISMLPIELLNFDANLIDSKVNLNWSTASEINNAYFTIERSADGKLWTEISQVPGAGTSNTQLDYMDIDYNPLPGVSYYRLKQTDFNGDFTYSDIQVIKNGDLIPAADINPYPNPSDGNSFNLEFTGFSDEEVLVVVRDVQGKTYYSKVYLNADNKAIFAVSLENQLPAGTYFITASSDENMISKKIIVK